MIFTILDDGSEQILYDDPAIPLLVRRSALSRFPDFQIRSHWHEELELFYATQGNATVQIGSKRSTSKKAMPFLSIRSSLIPSSRRMGLTAGSSAYFFTPNCSVSHRRSKNDLSVRP